MAKLQETQINAIENKKFFDPQIFFPRGDQALTFSTNCAWSPLDKNFSAQKNFLFSIAFTCVCRTFHMPTDAFVLNYSALGHRIQKLEPKMMKNRHFG